MSEMKDWRRMLTEIGGYENGMIGVPASAVREMIEDIDCQQAEIARLTGKLEAANGLSPEYHAECFRHKATQESLDGCTQRVAKLAASLTLANARADAAERDALERAAKICWALSDEYSDRDDMLSEQGMAQRCAYAIRAAITAEREGE